MLELKWVISGTFEGSHKFVTHPLNLVLSSEYDLKLQLLITAQPSRINYILISTYLTLCKLNHIVGQIVDECQGVGVEPGLFASPQLVQHVPQF